jgi:PPM family protein phosphatase
VSASQRPEFPSQDGLVSNLRVSVVSRVGGRDRNEDACGHWSSPDGAFCCVLSDGAGGHAGGDVASRTAVDLVLRSFADRPQCAPNRVAGLIAEANREVMLEQSRNARVADMRATLVVLVCDQRASQAVWGHIGDSRLYCLRGGFVLSQTKDHSLFQSMVDAGFADPARSRGHPDRNVLTGSLGSDDGLVPDVLASPLGLKEGDAFLLCSDGFWDFLDEARIEAALQRALSPEAWLAELEQIIVAGLRRGSDNYSAIAVWFGTPDFSTRIGAPRTSTP